MIPPGFKTSEGIVVAVTVAYAIVNSLVGVLPDRYAVVGAAVASGLYAIGRGIAKHGKPRA